MGNFHNIMKEFCCIDTDEVLENDAFHDTVFKSSNFEDITRTPKPKDENSFIHLNTSNSQNSLPFNKIEFDIQKNNTCEEVSSLSKLPISTQNVIRKQICNPFDYYDIIKNLGKGSYGRVFKVVHKNTGVVRAMKVISKNNLKYGFSDDDISQEINILKTLIHPHIIKLYEFYIFMGNYYLINEFCTEGDLGEKLDELQFFPEIFVKFLMIQIFNAVDYLNENGIIHGDLKLENIMIDSYLKEKGNEKKINDEDNFVESVLEDEKDINEIKEYVKKKSLFRRSLTINQNNNKFYKDNILNSDKSERNSIKNFSNKNNLLKKTNTINSFRKSEKLSDRNFKISDIDCSPIKNKNSIIANKNDSFSEDFSRMSVSFAEKDEDYNNINEEPKKFNNNFITNFSSSNSLNLINNSSKKLNDMKLKNFELKLIDFGCSKVFNRYKKNFEDTIGTLAYSAPEVLRNSYNEKCDIWSCGVIMYVLLSGKFPFEGKTEEELTKKILSGKFEFPNKYFYNISQVAKDLIKKCLIYDKNKRISAKEALRHEFFSSELDINNLFEDEVECKNLLNDLKNYSAETKFYQTVLAYLSHNFADKEELRKLKQIFYKIDLNLDGKISKEELLYAYKEADISMTEEELKKIMNSIDYDGNGYIEYEEFIRVALNKEKLFTEKNLRTAFDLFDLDKNGSISMNEVKEVLGIGKVFDENANKELMNEIKDIGNKEMSFEEFKDLLLKKN